MNDQPHFENAATLTGQVEKQADDNLALRPIAETGLVKRVGALKHGRDGLK